MIVAAHSVHTSTRSIHFDAVLNGGMGRDGRDRGRDGWGRKAEGGGVWGGGRVRGLEWWGGGEGGEGGRKGQRGKGGKGQRE